jgi:hypothetical protein
MNWEKSRGNPCTVNKKETPRRRRTVKLFLNETSTGQLEKIGWW